MAWTRVLLGIAGTSTVRGALIGSTLDLTGSAIIGGGTALTKRTHGAAATITDGATITHGFGSTPTRVFLQTTVAGEMASATTVGATTITVGLKKHDGTAGTSQTIYWAAES